jgi:hypothetical protein
LTVADQGANNGAGQAAGKSFVSFSRGAAQRIAKTVRTVEQGNRNQPGLTFDHPMPSTPSVSIRFAYYTATANWTVAAYTAATTTNNTKIIQFASPTSTPFQTALCVNHLASMPRLTTVATNAVMMVVAFKDGEFYKLIGAQS